MLPACGCCGVFGSEAAFWRTSQGVGCGKLVESSDVQGVKGFLVGGVVRPQDESHCPFLHLLQLMALGEVKGRRPSWGSTKAVAKWLAVRHTNSES